MGGNQTTCDGEKLDSPNYNTKRLTQSNHQELRRKGIWIHLEDIYSALIEKTTIEKLLDCVDTVYAVYRCLKSYYLYYGSMDHEWNFREIEKVATYLCMCNCIIHSMITICNCRIINSCLDYFCNA